MLTPTRVAGSPPPALTPRAALGWPGVLPVATATPVECSEVRSLYLHIPFCEHKCTYCDFTSVAGVRGQEAYVQALIGEVRLLAASLPAVRLDTVFIGGGTPSLLDLRLLRRLLDTVRENFSLAPGAEVTMEANPSSTHERRATAWLESGVNRVSLGVQSLDPAVLQGLERVHGAEGALDAVRAVQRAGFPRVSTDLIYAVPGLHDRGWERTLDGVLELGCEHLSCYELTVEEDTPLALAVQRGESTRADPELALRQHWIAVDRAAAAGLSQYEVSNFARPGAECRHNLGCWRNQPYLAAGVGAHGHLPAPAAAALGMVVPADATAVRFWHTPSIATYVERVTEGRLPVRTEAVDAVAGREETLMLGLRLTEGVALNGAAERAVASSLAAAGLLVLDGARASATRRGQELLNAVIAELATAGWSMGVR